MRIKSMVLAATLCAIANANALADVEIVINAFNLPKENDKSLPITEENLGVVVVQELDREANRVVLARVFTGPTIRLLVPGVSTNDVLSFGFACNSPKDPTITDTTQIVTGMVVTGELMTLDIVVPVPKKSTIPTCPPNIRNNCNCKPPSSCCGQRRCRGVGRLRCK